MSIVAALYVQHGGVYYNLPDVDPWGLPELDAREYCGPYPVVAHPPCKRWGSMCEMVESIHPHLRVGDDDGCFAAALDSVRSFGGVLEHPANTRAWCAFDLVPPPLDGGWAPADFLGGWTCQVEQGHYGHRARKATWLYMFGHPAPPSLRWGRSAATAWCSWGDHDKYRTVERLTKRESARTPEPFRDLLLEMARSCYRKTNARSAL